MRLPLARAATKAALAMAVIGGVLTAAGCGPSTGGRMGLSGTVIFKEQPLASGTIEFASEDQTQLTGGRIRAGAFEIPASQGVRPGRFVVRIFAAKETPADQQQGPPGPEALRQQAKDIIPPEFNVQSKLVVQVRGDEPNRFEFVIP